MKNLENYMDDGRVNRVKVTMAVSSGELTRDDIISFCGDPRMKSAYIGTSYSHKCPKDKWDKKYLDKLVCSAVAESFNEDYLLYLNEVAEYVRGGKKKAVFRVRLIIGAVALILIALAAAAINHHIQSAEEIPPQLPESGITEEGKTESRKQISDNEEGETEDNEVP